MIIIGHRGASGYAPEHTFASWDLALEMGVDYIEQDLQMTRDGILVVLHDDTLDRTSGGARHGPVIYHTYREIADCDVGSWFNRTHPGRARPEYAGQRIPTLDTVLDRYKDRARFYIETKNPASAPGMEEELLRLLDHHGLLDDAAPHRVIIQSFSGDSLRKLRAMNSALPLVRLFGRHETSWSMRLRLDRIARYASGIGPNYRDLDGRLLAAAHARNLVVHPYTVNDENVMRRLARLGVDGMFTDYPDVLARVLAGP
jgi:glycerophosphoryl diester phosphodiesterase